LLAGAEPQRRVRVRVVFCQPRNDRPTWPNIGYDYPARERQLLDALRAGCPDIEFSPARLVDQTVEDSGLLSADQEVEGYIVCLLGLGWQYQIDGFAGGGKPVLVVDNLYGGSGQFLTRTGRVLASGAPVDWVSSSDDQDLVASARNFALLRSGSGAQDVAAAFRATRRERTPAVADWTCQEDPVTAREMDEALAELRQTRILVVGGGWGGDAFRKASHEVTGLTFVPVPFTDLAAAYEMADEQPARAFAERWIEQADAIVEPSRDEIDRSGRMYVAMTDLMRKHGARGISINCLPGFYDGTPEGVPMPGILRI
jgi:hypothetical protein